MKRIRLYTNEGFVRYIAKFGKFTRNEDRWDSLDLDDITTDVQAPSQGEINSAIRELDLLDDAAIETGSTPTVDPGTGIIELDFDDKKPKKKPGRPSKKLKMKSDDDSSPVRTLDLDSEPAKNVKSSDLAGDGVRELDFAPDAAVSTKDSNIGGAIGNLDYDDDVDTSTLVASIEDVYTGLASPDGEIVQGLIKRYANDLTDAERLKEIMLTHAVQCNYDSLRAVCGDMRISLTAKEKELGYINKADVDQVLKKLRKLARSLTGANNTYGLIPNAIANCNPNNQIDCINIVDFLHEILGMSLQPIYYRGAFLLHCYDLANYILDELEDELSVDLLFGKKGLFRRAAKFTDIPDSAMQNLIKKALVNFKNTRSSDLADLIVVCMNYPSCINTIKKSINFNSVKGELILNYLEDNDMLTEAQLNTLRN